MCIYPWSKPSALNNTTTMTSTSLAPGMKPLLDPWHVQLHNPTVWPCVCGQRLREECVSGKAKWGHSCKLPNNDRKEFCVPVQQKTSLKREWTLFQTCRDEIYDKCAAEIFIILSNVMSVDNNCFIILNCSTIFFQLAFNLYIHWSKLELVHTGFVAHYMVLVPTSLVYGTLVANWYSWPTAINVTKHTHWVDQTLSW